MSNSPGRGLGRRSSRLQWGRITAVTTAMVGTTVLVAACSAGSGSSQGGGSANSTGSSTQSAGLLAFSSCMRSHGVSAYPDPDSSGEVPKESLEQLGVSQSQFNSALSTCQHLMPGNSLSGQASQSITVQQQQDYLSAAACMRSHGITNFPSPVFSGGSVTFPNLQHAVDVKSTQFLQAYQICQKLIPPGLPYSSGSA
jgi:hypothetical protein